MFGLQGLDRQCGNPPPDIRSAFTGRIDDSGNRQKQQCHILMDEVRTQ